MPSNTNTPIDDKWIAEKLKVAEAATPGPWRIEDDWTHEIHSPTLLVGKIMLGSIDHGNDAEHIATFDPPTVIRILREVERLRAENARLRFLLWEHHAHEGKYGDDGQIQCGSVDFKNDPLSMIERHLLTEIERALTYDAALKGAPHD